MKVGDLIQHRLCRNMAVIIKEVVPSSADDPNHLWKRDADLDGDSYYKILWTNGDVTIAPLNILTKLWEVIGENPRNSNV